MTARIVVRRPVAITRKRFFGMRRIRSETKRSMLTERSSILSVIGLPIMAAKQHSEITATIGSQKAAAQFSQAF